MHLRALKVMLAGVSAWILTGVICHGQEVRIGVTISRTGHFATEVGPFGEFLETWAKKLGERGGMLVLAHPFRYHEAIQIDIEQYPPDAIEIHSANIGACDESRIRAVAGRLHLRLLCNSDAHNVQRVGIYYNELARVPRDEKDLLAILKAGEYACGCMAERIAAFNEEVEERERLIRRMIAEGRVSTTAG